MSSPPPKHSLSSPTSGNTPHPVLPTPSSSTSVSIRQNNKASQLKRELEQQLLEKQKQLRESSSGIGKNVLARQVTQLQDRIKELDSGPSNPSSSTNDDIQPSSVDRLRSLERDLSSYRSHPLSPGISSIRNKEKLLNQRSANGLDPLPSPSTSTLLPPTHGHDSTSLLPLPPPPTGSTPTKRRSKIPNTDRRNTDIEFATEIGQGLLLEVRKMQALLQEKEEKLRTLENQKADLERAAEAMAKQMRQREENEEKLKEETWNLELAKQELTISVTELQQNLSKANVEQNKLAKQVNDLRSEIEQLRDREEKLTNTIDNMKQRHEQDMSSIRRHAAAIQREKTDQTKQIEALTSELAIAKAQSRIGKHVSTDTEPSIRAGETTDDQAASTLAVKNDTSPSSSPPSSPKQSPARNQAMEVETLKTSLAHAHRMVSNLRSNLHKEKTEKFEFKKLLAESQETIEQLQNDPRMWVDAGPNRSTSGSTSNMAMREDGSTPGRRSHKALGGSKRRGGRKGTSGRHKLKGTSQNATADDDSVYSYSSMSDQEDSEEVDSFDESDAGFGSGNIKKKAVGFTPLSSELSQVQMQKTIVVDAEVNTDPIDDFSLPLPVLGRSEQRSLSDELNSVTAERDVDGENKTSSMKNIAGGLAAGAAAVLGLESLSKSNEAEPATQTKNILEHQVVLSVAIEPREPIKLELDSRSTFSIEPEDPSVALAATNAAIAAARLSSLQAAVDSSTQSEEEDPSIALAAIEAAVSASRTKALEAAMDCSSQCDEIVEDPAIAEAAEAAKAAAIAAGITAGIADHRKAAIEAGIDMSIQAEEDPSIAQAEKAAAAAALTAGIAAGIAKSRSEALEAAVDTSVQHEEDPAIAEAEKAARAAALASGIADGISKSRSDAILAAVDSSVQYEEDPSIAEAEEAAKAAAIAAGVAAGVAAGIARLRKEAHEAAIDSSVQYEEDPSIVEAEEAAKAAAIESGISAGIAKLQSEAREAAVDVSVQHEEDPIVTKAEEDAREAAIAAAVASGIAAGIAKLQNEAREAAVDTSVQYEEDPSVVEAEETAKAAAIAAGIAAGIAKLQNEAREAAVDSSVQYEADPAIIGAEENDKAAAIAAGIAAGIAKLQNEAREAAVDSSVQYEEDPSIAETEEAAKSAAIAAGIAAGVAAGIAKLQSEARDAAVDTSVQYEEDPSIAEAEESAKAAAIATAVAESLKKSRVDALEAAIDTSVQYEEDPSIAEAEEIAKAAAISAGIAAGIAKLQTEAHEAAVDSSVQYEEDPSVAEAEEAAKAAAIAAGISEAVHKKRVDALEAAVDSSVQSEAEDPSIAAAALANAINTARAAALEKSIDASVQYEEPHSTNSSKVAGIAAAAAALSAVALGSTGSGPTHRGVSTANDGEAQSYHNEGVGPNERKAPALVGDSQEQVNDIQDEVQSTEVGKQRGITKTNKDLAAVIAMPSGSSRTISDSEDEFFDAQSKPSSRRTIDSFSTVKPDSRRSHLNEEITPAYQNNGQQFENTSNEVKEESIGKVAIPDVVDHDNVAPRSISSNKQPIDNVSSEKMYSKTEADALIAAAVAAALAAAKSSKRDSSDINDDHGPDSAVVSTSHITDDDDEYGDENEDYGNVVVHLPREEDTITSLPVDHITERSRDRAPISSTTEMFSSDIFGNINPSSTEEKEQVRPELTKGPTVVFDQEPEEREITEADVPQRPSNPPPEALLSRASLSPAFTNNRSMSPNSSRSKGKAPMEYSDLESSSPSPSNEDLYRTALLQQQQQHLNNKRGSVSASSISTNNTNEQLQSIHSSQNDAITRTSAATDPAMINLITQTMIGDWMYKYTRKAVGGGLSENRHQRYFWIHPYTRTLYWSTNAPGVDGNEAKAKSALIENITTVPDYSNAIDGAPNVSLLIQTSNRPLKLTAPTVEKHELWFEAISHLLARNRNSNGLTLLNDTKKADNTNARSVSSGTTGSLLNRPSFRRLHDIFQHPSSSTSVETGDDHIELDDEDEALEDVRMCCNGKHHVSKLEKDHTHRHQYRKRKSRPAVATIG